MKTNPVSVVAEFIADVRWLKTCWQFQSHNAMAETASRLKISTPVVASMAIQSGMDPQQIFRFTSLIQSDLRQAYEIEPCLVPYLETLELRLTTPPLVKTNNGRPKETKDDEIETFDKWWLHFSSLYGSNAVPRIGKTRLGSKPHFLYWAKGKAIDFGNGLETFPFAPKDDSEYALSVAMEKLTKIETAKQKRK